MSYSRFTSPVQGPKFFQDLPVSKCAVPGLQKRPTSAHSLFYNSHIGDTYRKALNISQLTNTYISGVKNCNS